MGNHLVRKIFFLITFLSFLFICASCSSHTPNVRNAKVIVVFNYESLEDYPKASFSVFVDSISNPRRFETIDISSTKTEYQWKAENLIYGENDDNLFCGITNLIMPQNENIPQGEYKITYYQADEEKIDVRAYLSYDDTFYKTKGSEVSSIMNNNRGSKRITIFDSENQIMYYGERTPELSSSRKIWNEYNKADKYQESWISANGKVICTMPIEKLKPNE